MSEENKLDDDVVNVFTHSSTGFPGAWSESEIQVLLDAWQGVLERRRNWTSKRFNLVQRLMRRLERVEGFRSVTPEEVRKQIDTLRNEYTTYKGLLKIPGMKAFRAPCADQLEQIFDVIPTSRRRLDSQGDGGGVSEDSDASRRPSVSERDRRQVDSNAEQEEMTNQKPQRVRFQRRVNLPRLIRVLVNQQQNMVDHLDSVCKTLGQTNDSMLSIAEKLQDLQVTSVKKEVE